MPALSFIRSCCSFQVLIDNNDQCWSRHCRHRVSAQNRLTSQSTYIIHALSVGDLIRACCGLIRHSLLSRNFIASSQSDITTKSKGTCYASTISPATDAVLAPVLVVG